MLGAFQRDDDPGRMLGPLVASGKPEDKLPPLGAARSRRMFGGHGLYVDDLFVALARERRA